MIDIPKSVAATSEVKAAPFRKSLQPLLPQRLSPEMLHRNGYAIYPYHSLGNEKINGGFVSLAQWMLTQRQVIIDGYSGVLWDDVYACLADALQNLDAKIHWIFTSDYLKPTNAIDKLVQPFLGTKDSVWGKRCNHTLSAFFDVERLQAISRDEEADCTVVIGVGAALCNWKAPVVYLDVPKNEIQYRMRAGAITNLGAKEVESATNMYKRFYFVDWLVLNEHKKKLLPTVAILGDVQWKGGIAWAFSGNIQQGLKQISQSVFRVRPWFEPGAWGGQWMKERIEGLNKAEVNYAWSFELIVPENGLLFESDGYLMELSFDFLMFQEATQVLGKHTDFFGEEFPIRFDFLDTFDGGNLSIQCHPSLQYIREEFGENITQDETYYILDCKRDAQVYLGFQEGIDPDQFRLELEESQAFNKEIDISKYVQSLPAKKHDLFLIPNGTVHSAGANNLVLEISATPYIFTFKMYDWMRMDLNGQPRPINLDHAFKNLRFERQGQRVREELVSKPIRIDEGPDWELIHLPTHKEHFYDVHRIEFVTAVTIETNDVCHILMLVEGAAISVQSADGTASPFHYAETFVVPAAAKSYTLTNTASGRAKVVKAFVKMDFPFPG